MNMTVELNKIAENIRKVRLDNNLTQIEMADVLGYSERTIRRLETNGTNDINVINLIATAFKISAQSILFGCF